MPAGFKNEDGLHPGFADRYGAKQHSSPEYPPRTEANVKDCDCVLWLGDPRSPGGQLTLRLAREMGRLPISVVGVRDDGSAGLVAKSFVRAHGERPFRLLVAGNRESSAPGIGAWAERYLVELFALLGHPEIGRPSSSPVVAPA